MNEVINFLQSEYRAAGSADKNGLANAHLHGWYDSSNGLPNKTFKKNKSLIKVIKLLIFYTSLVLMLVLQLSKP